MLFGGYEPDPVSRWLDGVPWEHAAANLPADEGRFAQLWAGAARRFPFLEDAGMVTLECHPDAMTPDGNPLLGPVPGTPGFWLAAGLSLNGFGGAGGIGAAIAEWMTGGEAELDTSGMRAWRFGDAYRRPAQVDAAGREVYRYYYRLRYPDDSDEWGRPNRLSALHGRLQDAGAVFGVKNGWERADHVAPGRPWRRAGADQRGYGWTTPPWFGTVAEEHRAFRERVAMIDMTSFGKLELTGPGALPLLERACDNRIGRDAGQRRLHADAEPPRRDRRRCHRHPARGRALPRDHRRRGGRVRPRLAGAGAPRGGRAGRDRGGDRASDGDRHLGPARARGGGRLLRRRRVGRGVPVPQRAHRSASARRCWRSGSATSASPGSSCTCSARTRCRCGTGWPRPAARTTCASPATAAWTGCGWRRATATWAPT